VKRDTIEGGAPNKNYLLPRQAAGKKSCWELFFTHHRVNFNDPGAGFAGVILILPAGIARPTPAENALAELGDGVRRAAEIAHVLGETVGIL